MPAWPRPDAAGRTAAAVAAGCVVVAAFAVDFSRRHVEMTEQARFRGHADLAVRDVVDRVQAQELALRGARAMLVSSGDVRRDDWRRYCGSLRLRDAYGGMQALAFVARVPVGEVPAFVARERADGAPAFRVEPSPPAEGDVLAVRLAEPEALNAEAVGRDLGRDPVLRGALEHAAEGGVAALSAPVRMPEVGWKQRAVLLALPVYRTGEPAATPEERRAALLGWVAGVLDPDALLGDGGERAVQGVALDVFDGPAPQASGHLHEGAAQLPGVRAREESFFRRTFREEHRVVVAGRTWTIRLSALPSFDDAADWTPVWVTAAIGLAITCLLTLVTWALAATKTRAVELAERMSVTLRRSEERHRKILETTLDAVVTVDSDGRVCGWNGRAEELFGWSRAEAWGRNVVELLVPPDARERHARAFRAAVDGGAELNRRLLESEATTRDGRRVPVEIALGAQRADGDVLFTAFVREISARREAERQVRAHVADLEQAQEQLRAQAGELARAKEDAEAANRAKSEFLATMSHEIRTPMNGVLGMTSLLLDTPLDAEQRDYVQVIRSSGDALLTLIDDVLDFSKIEAGCMTLEAEPFDLRVAAEEVVEILATKAAEKGVDLALRYAPAAPRRFVGDPGRVRQVLLNLAGNALKFSDRGHVLVDVDCDGCENGRARLRVKVVDQGIGIPADKLHVLFQRFQQADSSTTRRFGGTGLGLAISRRLVNLMGGAIGVDSRPGEGSTFWFTLDLPLAGDPPPEATPPADLEGLRCLVVDDVAVNRRIVGELVASWGLHAEEAGGADEALERLRAAARAGRPYRLALVDLHMPGTDGLTLGRAIRADPQLAPTLLVLLSSSHERLAPSEPLDAGFAALLIKPFRSADLRDAIATVWAGRDRPAKRLVTRHSLAEARAAAREALRTSAGTVLPPLRVLLAEDNAVNQKVAVRMLERLGCSVDVAANGADAVARVQRSHYDVVFMDCQMPEMDGFEATRAIRCSAAGDRRVPIVAMTANALEGDRERCLAAGMDDYLPKPVRPEAVRTALERWCSSASVCTSHT